ncbi:MAG: hypothetical protein QOC98_2390 [Frankiaceae bacterium]|nr:hypothetical protein [Frankiaceae bacterium]
MPGQTFDMRALVTGATGYIGGRLVPRLLAAGIEVRAMTRSASRLSGAPWRDQVEVVEADALEPETLVPALAGTDVAYYLVHSIDSGMEFGETDRQAAEAFASACADAGVRRIVYLGGLLPAQQELSEHLRSRAEVGDILLASGVPTAVLQAAIILGSGSASFEMLRHLTDRLPVMTAPRWVETRTQPIAVRDVLRYLVGAANLPSKISRRFDIGGPDVLTYREMMQRYAAVAGLRKRLIIGVPLLSPALTSQWVGLITPVPAQLARPLVRSLANEVVCSEHDIVDFIPDPPEGLLGVDDAIRLALLRVRESTVTSRWSDAPWPGAPSDPLPSDPDWAGGRLYRDIRSRVVSAPRDAVWRQVERIGGQTGWHSMPAAWAARGALDVLAGGMTHRRGRRDPQRLSVGESVDFWRVEHLERGEILRLRGEMKMPGLAWLEWRIEPATDAGPTGCTRITQRALFHPRGLAGDLYWWAVAPFHGIIFGDMIAGLSVAAEAEALLPADACRTSTGAAAEPAHIEGAVTLATPDPTTDATTDAMTDPTNPTPTGELR